MESDHKENWDMGERITLKIILKKYDSLDWIHLAQDRD
jgi:hypothetical protein